MGTENSFHTLGPSNHIRRVRVGVLDGYEHFLYFEEAENRLHVQKTVMVIDC
jgi:ornithine carbamoyltransferase